MTDDDWDLLMGRIKDGACTPFIGAGAAAGTLPLGGEVAKNWADAHHYPFPNKSDLVEVSQFLAVNKDPMWPKEEIQRELSGKGPPDFGDPSEPHRVLADLDLPLYITTNYDDFMTQALRRRGREPVQEICKWNGHYRVKNDPAPLKGKQRDVPTPEKPVVFHLHGRLGIPESFVLTHDDFLDFIVATGKRQAKPIPGRIEEALTSTSLLFIGYSLQDWNFRVLHRGLVTTRDPSLRRISVTVQMNEDPKEQAYLDKYFSSMDVSVFYGKAHEFCEKLRERWDKAKNE